MILRATALLLAASCLWAAEGHSDGTRSVSEELVQFTTKAKDSCTIAVSSQGEVTLLRVSCRSGEKPYWCEYQGKPQACRAYSNNARHYFIQIMWELRKLGNACDGPRVLKPQMCKRATDDAQMAFVASGPKPANQKPGKAAQERLLSRPRTDTPKAVTGKPAQAKSVHIKPGTARPLPVKPQPAKPALKTNKQKKNPKLAKTRTTTTTAAAAATIATGTTRPTNATTPDTAKTLAEDYCWESLQSICTYIIGWFHT